MHQKFCRPQRPVFLDLFHRRKPTATVWTADITYWIAGQCRTGRNDPAWNGEDGYLELHRELGVMPYYDYTRFWAARSVYGSQINMRTRTDGNRTTTTWTTPVGEISREDVFLPESATAACVRHPVQTKTDLAVLRCLIENRRLEPVNVGTYNDRLTAWEQYDGIPALGLPRSPLAALFYEWAGQEHAVYLLMDCETELQEIFELMQDQETPILDAICAVQPPVVHFPDNLCSCNLTSLYDRFMRETHRHRLERLQRAGISCVVHLDGQVAGLLPKLVENGFDAVEAVTPKPVGDIDVVEMRRIVTGSDTMLWGGGQEDNSQALSAGALEYKHTMESSLERRVNDILAAALGMGKAVVKVTADVTMSATEQTCWCCPSRWTMSPAIGGGSRIPAS